MSSLGWPPDRARSGHGRLGHDQGVRVVSRAYFASGLPSCPWNLPGDRPAPCRGWPRILARLAAWPLVSGQSASGGSMSRVAEGHFRRNAKRP